MTAESSETVVYVPKTENGRIDEGKLPGKISLRKLNILSGLCLLVWGCVSENVPCRRPSRSETASSLAVVHVYFFFFAKDAGIPDGGIRSGFFFYTFFPFLEIHWKR